MNCNLNSDGCRLAIGISVGVGVVSAAIGFAYLYRQKLLNTPPKKWRRVGEISDIICYPIKSCAPIRMSTVQCNEMGFEDDYLRDRVFMVTDLDGKFITSRTHPTLVLVQPEIVGNKMIVTAPGMLNLEISFSHLYTIPMERGSVWNESVRVVDCGEEAARWFSRFLHSEDMGFRLMYHPDRQTNRNCVWKKPTYKKLLASDSGALHDLTGYMMINEGSITELNSRLDHVVQPQQFRPNLVVKGPLAFEEDHWEWVKVGREVIFRNVKDCTRCILVNVNPQTGERNKSFQPLKTLKEYRMVLPDEDSPIMGINLGVRRCGAISLGDPVYVEMTYR